jgi:hypothetical protein
MWQRHADHGQRDGRAEASRDVWMGLESTDLTPEQAEQLSTYLKVAATRAQR